MSACVHTHTHTLYGAPGVPSMKLDQGLEWLTWVWAAGNAPSLYHTEQSASITRDTSPALIFCSRCCNITAPQGHEPP